MGKEHGDNHKEAENRTNENLIKEEVGLQGEDGDSIRQELLARVKRVVVKVGSAVLTNNSGLDKKVIDNLVRGIVWLRDSGREVILVSSGAVAAGKRKVCFEPGRTLTIKEKQALAAIGQSRLMHDYEEAFDAYGIDIAQILLTHSDLADRKRYLNVRNTLFTLLDFGVLPILNENDTVSTKELKFSDNDNLGALLSNLIEADFFISLTDVNALYSGNPFLVKSAKPVHVIARITPEIEAMCGHSKSALGTGGMLAKVRAAQMVAAGGGSSFIGSGKKDDILQRIFAGERIGSFFMPDQATIKSRKRWIAYVLKPKGTLTLDQGACQALCHRGKSLLPSGILAVDGIFERGDAVQCLTEEGVVIAVGLSNYSADLVRKIMGKRSDEIQHLLEECHSIEVLHRDNLVILREE